MINYTYYKEEDFIFVEGNDATAAYIDLILMAQCRNHIIANSTFSAAADLISICNEGITVAPSYWMNEKKTWDNNRWILL